MHFRTRDYMDYALRKLDGSDFRNPFEKSRISVSVHVLFLLKSVVLLLFPTMTVKAVCFLGLFSLTSCLCPW